MKLRDYLKIVIKTGGLNKLALYAINRNGNPYMSDLSLDKLNEMLISPSEDPILDWYIKEIVNGGYIPEGSDYAKGYVVLNVTECEP